MSSSIAVAHLRLRLKPMLRLLRAAADRLARPAFLPDSPPTSLGADELGVLFTQAEELDRWADPALAVMTSSELALERTLRERAGKAGLPILMLQEHLGLSEVEVEALVLCAAVEVDASYERRFAYVLDDLNRRAPCVELLCSLSASDAAERHARRDLLGPYARLVRCGVLRRGPDVGTEWRREVRLSEAAIDWLLLGLGSVASFRDPEELPAASTGRRVLLGADEAQVRRAVATLRLPGGATVAVYGPRQSCQHELPRELAGLAQRPLRTMRPGLSMEPSAVLDAARVARRLGAVLWLPLAMGGGERSTEERVMSAVEEAAALGTSLILSCTKPMRSIRLMSERPWFELAVQAPTLEEVGTLWGELIPELGKSEREELALGFRLSPAEMSAAANTFRTAGADATGILVTLRRLCRAVARRQTHRLATVIPPTRTAEDLILPDVVHASIVDVARFATAWPRVAERWRIAHLHRGAQGVRALFTGPSGTGKTLAAEVIAGILGQDLHKVDLAQLVSKWVGETEKNLDTAFDEAEQSQAVLFFDEADALFSKRGEVRHGSDRYANLEVSYLLQRLEDYAGLVIVATNLKENMDEAFTRRFHVSVDFQRPAVEERRKLWALAFPPSVPAEGIDPVALARLDMTGATIMNAARTAALLAACDGQVVRPRHVAEGIAREFRRESRLLLPSDLGMLTSHSVVASGARSVSAGPAQ